MAIFAESSGAAQNALGPILFDRDVPQRHGIGKEKRRRHFILGRRDDHVARAPNLERKIIVRFQDGPVVHLQGRMIGPRFTEDNIEHHGLGALGRQFMDEPPVNVSWPIQARAVTKLVIIRAHKIDTAFVDGNEGQVRRDRG